MLKDALACLPVVDLVSKPEVVVIFSYDTHGESLHVRPGDVSTVNARILREEENQDEDAYVLPRRVLLAPTVFVCDSAGTVNVQAFEANSQSRVWSTHRTLYLPSAERGAQLQEVRDGFPPHCPPNNLLFKCSRQTRRVSDILGVLGNQEGTKACLR